MNLTSLLTRIPRFLKFRTKKCPGLLDAPNFQRAALAERMRVDRNHSPLSFLLFKLPPNRSTTSDYDYLSKLLQARLRLTDSAGFLPDGRVGVLLPDTFAAGAWKVASDVCEVYPLGHDRPDCEVVVYPDPQGRGSDELPKRQLREPAGVSGSHGVGPEAFFSSATPWWKRGLDFVGAISGLIVAAPLIALAAVAIKLSSPGQVFYSQTREGLGGRRFQIWKLRTMHLNAEQLKDSLRPYSEQDGPAFKMMRDPRITPVGKILRRFSLDELPQLWNVVKGEMSLVGPRPLPVDESLMCAAWQRRRLHVTPGLTCIWQVEGRNVVPFDEWIRMDLEYVKRRSFLFDLKILLQTPTALVFAKGPR